MSSAVDFHRLLNLPLTVIPSTRTDIWVEETLYRATNRNNQAIPGCN